MQGEDSDSGRVCAVASDESSLCLRLQPCPFRDQSPFEIFPQGYQQSTRQRHNPDLAASAAGFTEPFDEPERQRAVGLVADPGPGHFDGNGSDVTIAGFADPLLACGVAAVVGCWGQAHQRTHLATVTKLPPAE